MSEPTDKKKPKAEEGDNNSSDNAVPVEIGGRNGPDPTRFGDWENKGRCVDF